MNRKHLFVAAATVALSAATTALAAPSLEVRLDPIQVGGPGSLVFDIQIWARVLDTLTAGGAAGGIGGMQVDIVSQGANQIAPVSAGTGPLLSKAKTTFNVTGFSTVVPSKIDATPALGFPADSDTDLDAIGLSIIDTNNFTNTTLGVGDWALIAAEQWQLTSASATDTLHASIVGANWYNFDTGVEPSFRGQFDSINTSSANVAVAAVPEPASVGVIGLAAGAAMLRRRRRGA